MRHKDKARGAWHWPRRVALVVVAALAALLITFGGQIHGNGVTGAAYAARVGCSCRFVGGRALGDCRKDFEPGMGLVWLSEDDAARSITARFPLVSTQTARFREGAGCVLEAWHD